MPTVRASAAARLQLTRRCCHASSPPGLAFPQGARRAALCGLHRGDRSGSRGGSAGQPARSSSGQPARSSSSSSSELHVGPGVMPTGQTHHGQTHHGQTHHCLLSFGRQASRFRCSQHFTQTHVVHQLLYSFTPFEGTRAADSASDSASEHDGLCLPLLAAAAAAAIRLPRLLERGHLCCSHSRCRRLLVPLLSRGGLLHTRTQPQTDC